MRIADIKKLKKDELVELCLKQKEEIEDLKSEAVNMDGAYVDLERSVDARNKEIATQLLRAFDNVMYRAECMQACDQDTSNYLLENIQDILADLRNEYL